jgi:hypothetical protein
LIPQGKENLNRIIANAEVENYLKKWVLRLGMMAHIYNPSYSEGKDQEDC